MYANNISNKHNYGLRMLTCRRIRPQPKQKNVDVQFLKIDRCPVETKRTRPILSLTID